MNYFIKKIPLEDLNHLNVFTKKYKIELKVITKRQVKKIIFIMDSLVSNIFDSI